MSDADVGIGRGSVSRQLAIAFGTIVLVALAMCATLLSELRTVTTMVADLNASEVAIRNAFELTAAVREQYIHIAHGVVEGDRSHVDHYGDWRERIVDRVQTLERIVPPSERWRVQEIGELTEDAHARFMDSLLPALDVGDKATVVAEHHHIQNLTERAAAHTDAITVAIEAHMAEMHEVATRATVRAFRVGAACVAIVIALSLLFIFRLRRAVLAPLRQLARTAAALGEGDSSVRVGAVGTGELLAVARSFDRMADELAERQAQLLNSERMAAIGQLAAGVAHELNNPIAIIRGYLKTMSPRDDPETLGEELRILDEEAERCQRIADDLLSYARPSEMRVESVDMASLLAEVVERATSSLEWAGAAITVNASAGSVDGDSDRLRQVFLNVLFNALQANPGTEPVDVVGHASDDHYEVIISDRGDGIPPATRRRIFEPFFSTRSDGTGLGLAVAHGIVDAHFGTVRASPRDEGGTDMIIQLPRTRPQ